MSKKPPSCTLTLRAAPLTVLLITLVWVFSIITQLSMVGTPGGLQLASSFQSLKALLYILVLLVTTVVPVAAQPLDKVALTGMVNDELSNWAKVGLIYIVDIGVPDV